MLEKIILTLFITIALMFSVVLFIDWFNNK